MAQADNEERTAADVFSVKEASSFESNERCPNV
jgi:hypothetical protein